MDITPETEELLFSILSCVIITVIPIFFVFAMPHKGNLKVWLAFAVGGLLGDAFLHLIPHAMEEQQHHIEEFGVHNEGPMHDMKIMFQTQVQEWTNTLIDYVYEGREDPCKGIFCPPPRAAGHTHAHDHGHGHTHAHDHGHEDTDAQCDGHGHGEAHDHGHEHADAHDHGHEHADTHDHGHEHTDAHDHGHEHADAHDHGHEHGDAHDHEHEHGDSCAHEEGHEHADDHGHEHDHEKEHHDHGHEHHHEHDTTETDFEHCHVHNHKYEHEHCHSHSNSNPHNDDSYSHHHAHDHVHDGGHKSHSHGHGHGHGHDHDHDVSGGLWILAGIMGFFILDVVVRNFSGESHGHGHSHSHGEKQKKKKKKQKKSDKEDKKSEMEDKINYATIILNLIADFAHNFTDGLAIGGTWAVSSRQGLVTTLAILFHEVPHEVGDFAILLQNGLSKWAVVKTQLFTGFGAMVGTIAGNYAGNSSIDTSWIPNFTAGGFIYIATVSVMPELLEDTDIIGLIKQVLAMSFGIWLMVVITWLE